MKTDVRVVDALLDNLEAELEAIHERLVLLRGHVSSIESDPPPQEPEEVAN